MRGDWQEIPESMLQGPSLTCRPKVGSKETATIRVVRTMPEKGKVEVTIECPEKRKNGTCLLRPKHNGSWESYCLCRISKPMVVPVTAGKG